jgi:glycosyltransferase involved in cell wall biosynthesis
MKTNHSSNLINLPLNNPLVSVVMNCYNGEAYLKEAIDSVLHQDYIHWELIFFDNASTDLTREIVQSYSDQRIRYYRCEITVSLGEARNLAIANTRGEYIAFLDSDDRWLPQKISLQLSNFDMNPEAGFIYANYYIINSNGKRRKRPSLKGRLPQGKVFSEFLRQYPVNLQTVMIRASTLDCIDSLFDPELELSEEYDLFMRILYHTSAIYLEEPVAEYRIHDNMSSIQMTNRYPTEYMLVLEKFSKMIVNFEELFKDELRDAQMKLNYYKARAELSRGNNAKARSLLSLHFRSDCRYLFLYFLTYLGKGSWNFFHWLFGKSGI